MQVITLYNVTMGDYARRALIVTVNGMIENMVPALETLRAVNADFNDPGMEETIRDMARGLIDFTKLQEQLLFSELHDNPIP